MASEFIEVYTKYNHGFVLIICQTDKYFEDKKIILTKDINDFPPEKYLIFIALSYRKLNKIREEKYKYFKEKKYEFISLIHPKNNINKSAKIGENCFIFENQTIQNNVVIGDNVILWSSNHIGHNSIIKNHVYISSHVVISGYVKIDERSFIGVNSAVADFCNIGKDCFIGMSSSIDKNLKDGSVSLNKSTDYYDNDNKISKND